MNAQDIINTIIAWHKDVAPEDVRELIVSRAAIGDLSYIRAELAEHVSSNEQNASDWALEVIDSISA